MITGKLDVPMSTSDGRTPTFSCGELFCGAGGLSRGFHDHGFRAWFANDLWDTALDTFLMNFDATYRATGGDQTGDIVPLRGSIENLDPSATSFAAPAPTAAPTTCRTTTSRSLR